jgi:D-aminoacyl-tRNA deacylase
VIGIIISRADSASVHIGEQLLDIEDWEHATDDSCADGGTVYRAPGFELREFDALHLELDRVADAFSDPDVVVFASRHAGETGPLLTAHHTGNFGAAEFGGRAGELAETCPNALSRVFDALTEHAPPEYDVGIECTHHGPTDVGAPSMFVELGSSESEWEDSEGARAVARAILDLREVTPERDRQLVGFGGGHYAPRFERVVRETDWTVGHIGAEWVLAEMGDVKEDVLQQAFERSGATRALVEGDNPKLEEAIETLGYRVVSETWVRETEGVSLEFVAEAETLLTTVDEGLRFGTPAKTDAIGEFTTDCLPAALLEEVEGIDADATRETTDQYALAFDTEQAGTRLAGRVVLGDADDRERIIDEFVQILNRKYDAVERHDGEIIARETAFDPGKAREAGVSAGPKFGRLADGESVMVDGLTVEPHTVHTERECRFSLGRRDTRRTEGER